jgi:amino acid adenylation domain-containing protein
MRKIGKMEIAFNKKIKERNYWLTKLSGEFQKTTFPCDFTTGNLNEKTVDSLKFKITGELFSRLLNICSGSDAKLHVVLVTGISLLLNKYTGKEDILLGTPIYLQEIEGEFINTVLVIRNRVKTHLTFKELLLQVHRTIVEAAENQNYPIESLLYDLNMSFSGNDFPLFDIVVLLENIHNKKYIQHVKPNIIFSFLRTDDGLEGTIEYDARHYKRTTIQGIGSHFKNLLRASLSNVNVPGNAIDMMSEEEKKALLSALDNTANVQYPDNKTIQELFEEQAKKHPHKIAVVLEHEHLTYSHLNTKANQIARLLRSKGVKPDNLIALIMEPSVEMIIAILGTLKAGGAYLPLEPDYPIERIKSMLNDSRVSFLLTRSSDIKEQFYQILQGFQPSEVQICQTEPRPQVTDFDGLPFPDRSLINHKKYNQYIGQATVSHAITLQATRGCPYQCAYCHRIWPKNHVIRSAENIFKEVLVYYNMGIKRFVFVDDIFNLNSKNSMRFFQLIIEKGLEVHLLFPNGLRGDLLTKEYIDLMVEAGTINIALALETASPRLQKLIGKNLDIEKLHQNAKYICEKYPHVILEIFTMQGFPTETEEEALMTLNFVKNLKWLHFPYLHILKIYPNTGMEKLAIANGTSPETIRRAENLAFHDSPETFPFSKEFTGKWKAELLNEYFLSKERLLHVLPYQMKVLTEDEILQKYSSYFAKDMKNLNEFLEFCEIKKEELGAKLPLNRDRFLVPDLDEKLRKYFPANKPAHKALRILLIDLSQHFTPHSDRLKDLIEPPLGLMYIQTYLTQRFGSKINGRILKSRIDFDNYAELKALLDEFKPEVIGIRTLTFFKNFFHKTVSMIRQWGIDVPIIVGGPYATSSYQSILKDRNINLAVLGEGEITFGELIQKMLENEGKLPGENVLKHIKGIAFIPEKNDRQRDFNRGIILLDLLDERDQSREPIPNPVCINQPHHLAYTIFTSGSSGKPKGVLIEHGNVVRLMFHDPYLFDFRSSDVWSMFHTYCFDFSVWEMYGALLYGGKLVVISKMTARDPERFLEVLKENKVTVLNQTPSAFHHLAIEELRHSTRELNLKYIIFGGEMLNPIQLKNWKQKYPDTRLINMFGITETTVHVTFKEIKDKEIELNISNIGNPIPTLSVYVLDHHLNLLPRGVPGELVVGGEGVGRGYLNRPALTKDRFIDNPFRPGETLYKSGDLVRILDCGDMEYLGRIDHQVKVRGYRIELGEIEGQLLKQEEIKKAVVIEREDKDGDKYLCAYIVAGKELDTFKLKESLLNELPDYMVPPHYIRLEKMPLTPNGKINTKELPIPSGNIKTRGEYIGPHNETEKKLVEIWKDVLQLEQPGIKDNFFMVGGDSIKAIKLLHLINNQLNVNLKIPDLYLNETIEELAVKINKDKTGHTDEKPGKIRKKIEELKNRILAERKLPGNNIEDIFPMSGTEKGMVFHYLKSPNEGIYHVQIPIQVKYPGFDREVLKKAFELMVRKHPILRTAFNITDFEEPVQIVYKGILPDIIFDDISQMDESDQENHITKFLIKDRKIPFDISAAPLWRLRIFDRGSDNICVTITSIHAILDGWSFASLITELHNTYLTLQSNPGFIPQQLKNTYKESVIQEIMEKEKKEIADYWRMELSGYKRLEIFKLERNNKKFPEMKEYWSPLGKNFFEKLENTAKNLKTTVKTLCVGAYVYTLNMISYENDITVGLVTNFRPVCEDGDKILGCFLNTVPLRIKIPENITWKQYSDLIDGKMMEIKEHEKLPLYEIARIIGEKSEDQNPLFDTLLNFVDFHVYYEARVDNHNMVSKPLSVDWYLRTNTLLDFCVDISFDRFELLIHYVDSFISDDLAKKLCDYFIAVLNAFNDNSRGLAKKDEILSSEEKKKLLAALNKTNTNYPAGKKIHELFEEQVKKSPDSIAVVGRQPAAGSREDSEGEGRYCSASITYKELNHHSNQLAHLLQTKGVTTAAIVGIMVEPSIEMITGLLGILKTGGAYLPIDPEYPTDRLEYILGDSSANVLITTSTLVEKAKKAIKYKDKKNLEIVFLDFSTLLSFTPSPLPSSHLHLSPRINAPATSLACVIYTSGTTGKPKGVLVSHRGIVNYAGWKIKTCGFNSKDITLQLLSYSFDGSGANLYPALFSGGTLVMPPGWGKIDLHPLKALIRDKGITNMSVVPGIYRIILDNTGKDDLKSLRFVVLGGENPGSYLIKKSLKRYPGIKLINEYGPTETTIASTANMALEEKKPTIIGKPIANTHIYILDCSLNPLPAGIPGELCITGKGVSEGYLNMPVLTSERFVENPINPGEKMYRTGDLARRGINGTIEFLGRTDRQVKVRGYRVEPGEIENHIKQTGDIEEVLVVDRTDGKGEKYFCAYIVSQKAIDVSKLQDYLCQHLPHYMIPTSFVKIDNLPFTPNGKSDRKALPDPGFNIENRYVPPGNEIEDKLAGIWSEVLNIDKDQIGIDANFFQLGGHSIQTSVLMSRINKGFNIRMPLVNLFKTPTIKKLGEYITGTKTK